MGAKVNKESKQVRLNIPVAHFGPILSWDQSTIEKLVQEACRIARDVGVPGGQFPVFDPAWPATVLPPRTGQYPKRFDN